MQRKYLGAALQHGLSLPFFCVLISVFSIGNSHAQVTRHSEPRPFTTEVERCILPASQFHGVNHYVLRSILKIESGLKPGAVGKNRNGTEDVGIGQMNSMHFRELSKYGIAPEHLKNACVGTYVAAWHLSKTIARYGNTWFGIAAYHSATPYFNRRYQALLNNEMVKSGALQGPVLHVPPLIQ